MLKKIAQAFADATGSAVSAAPAKGSTLAIIASGAVTSLGASSASTCAAIRSSLDNFQETHFIDEIGQPLLGARVPDELLGLVQTDEQAGNMTGSITGGNTRLAAMFVKAAIQCVKQIGGIDASKTALLLIGPEESRPGFSLDKLEECFAACQAAVGKTFHEASRITQLGSPGLAAALHYAQQLLGRNQEVRHILIAGLDSLLNTDDINAALNQERLLSSDNSDGFIPGEAAVCLLAMRLEQLAEHDEAGKDRLPVLKVAGVGLAQEEQTLDDDKPSRGVGLAQAMRQALTQANLPPHAIHARMSDISAESYFFEEASYAWTRVLRVRSPEGYRFFTPMNRVGHVGSAMGPLMACIALDAARKNWAEGPYTLLQLSSAGKPRGAVVLSQA